MHGELLERALAATDELVGGHGPGAPGVAALHRCRVGRPRPGHPDAGRPSPHPRPVRPLRDDDGGRPGGRLPAEAAGRPRAGWGGSPPSGGRRSPPALARRARGRVVVDLLPAEHAHAVDLTRCRVRRPGGPGPVRGPPTGGGPSGTRPRRPRAGWPGRCSTGGSRRRAGSPDGGWRDDRGRTDLGHGGRARLTGDRRRRRPFLTEFICSAHHGLRGGGRMDAGDHVGSRRSVSPEVGRDERAARTRNRAASERGTERRRRRPRPAEAPAADASRLSPSRRPECDPAAPADPAGAARPAADVSRPIRASRSRWPVPTSTRRVPTRPRAGPGPRRPPPAPGVRGRSTRLGPTGTDAAPGTRWMGCRGREAGVPPTTWPPAPLRVLPGSAPGPPARPRNHKGQVAVVASLVAVVALLLGAGIGHATWPTDTTVGHGLQPVGRQRHHGSGGSNFPFGSGRWVGRLGRRLARAARPPAQAHRPTSPASPPRSRLTSSTSTPT